ncbi:hypothetical protein D3P07_08450 [Paenibacillus sp. 1011MAR3C5]|uniref:GerAB/ArcD/ProY family transporter n=1 Tax=Paenibacillus sp. 1011MAR3C5 TaxID=1675787 RepID=UPI000E6C5521|nr:GerAB/ArcD/ProY family transporter [Paenibacillus sp. 1011MAR3C5]RJE90230.1 hypothetical protein D3P07_08450 [Paenibacillus sp. 1011MAR3C5]
MHCHSSDNEQLQAHSQNRQRWAVRRGFEVIARTGQIFVPIITLFTVLILVLLIPELNPHHLLPQLERGARPVLQGSLVVDGWFSQLLLAVYVLPLVFLFPMLLCALAYIRIWFKGLGTSAK